LWLTNPDGRSFSHLLHEYDGIALGALFLIAALCYARKHRANKCRFIAAVFTGMSITLAWVLTSWHAANSFNIVLVKSVSFTGPSADTLMALINQPEIPMSFDIGLIEGVFITGLSTADGKKLHK
jgi:hypothetical protein